MDLATLDQALFEVKDLKVSKLSEHATVEMNPEAKTLSVFDGTDRYDAALSSYDQTLRHIGLSHGMAKRLSPSTSTQVASELLKQKGRATALTRDGELLALAPKGRYKELPVDVVLAAVEEGIGADVECNRAMVLPRYGVRLELTGDQEYEPVKGDLIRAGVLIDFSPVGLTNPTIQSFGVRLVCTNGMTSNQVLESYVMTGDSGETKTWLEKTVKTAYAGVAEAVERWREMAGISVSNHDRTLLLGGIARDARFNAKEQTALFAKATEENPETAYDVLNLATWVTSHLMTQPQRVVRAQASVARFVQDEIYHRHCPTCNRSGG